MSLPHSLKVMCVLRDAPVAGAWVTATMHMNDKTDFISFHGPAGADGSIDVRGDDLLQWAKLNRDFAPGDYLDPELDWTGSLTVTPLTVDAARAAIKFHAMFKERLNYPATFAEDLRALISVLKPFEGEELIAKLVRSDPPEAAEAVKVRRRPV